jgi:hypothetical protein
MLLEAIWATSVIFFVVKICHFAIKLKGPGNMVKAIFWKITKKSPHLDKETYKITKVFRAFV